MRYDIPNDIIERAKRTAQTIADNSEPYLHLVLERQNPEFTDLDFAEKRRIRTTTTNSISDADITVRHPELFGEDTEIWTAFIRNGKLVVRWAENTANLREIDWNEYDIGNISAIACAIGFEAKIRIVNGLKYYVTKGKYPLVFYVNGDLHCLIFGETMQDSTLVSGNITDVAVSREVIDRNSQAQVLPLVFVQNGTAKIMLKNDTWGQAETIGSCSAVNVNSASDAIVAMLYVSGAIQIKAGYISGGSVSWESTTSVSTADGLGAYYAYDEEAQIIYPASGLKYYIGVEAGSLSTASGYAETKIDITRDSGAFYLMAIRHGNNHDFITLFHYSFRKDASNFVQNVSYGLQIDNAINQFNATLKNLADVHFLADATLFSPSVKIKPYIRYGDSAEALLGIFFMDEVVWSHGGSTVSISSRNAIGAWLNDQTFDEDIDFNGTANSVLVEIFNHFGIEFYDLDPLGATIDVSISVSATDTGLKAIQQISDLLSEEGLQWDILESITDYEELEIIAGYDEFRALYLPREKFNFGGISDVFAKSVDRSIDGTYTQVRCIGTDAKGKELDPVVKEVATWKYWTPANHRTYHAERLEGTTQVELEAYAETLARQLKLTGRTITYTMPMQPQLVVGDIAVITDGTEEDDEAEQLGIITEVRHSMGVDGFITEFTATSGGDFTDAEGEVHSTTLAINGDVRRKRISDFINQKVERAQVSGILGSPSVGQDEDFVEIIRNIGFRLLDEPSDVTAEYDDINNEVSLTWTDPDDIDTNEPVPATWVGTVVVRKEGSAPLHRWDGTEIEDSTTRDEYSVNALVDNTVEVDKNYYYGIFPYHVAVDNVSNPIKHYRYTKVVTVTTKMPESYEFDYTGEIQTFTAPKDGVYKLEVWGAQGGTADDGENITASGGYGSYSVGEVELHQGDTLYIGVGGQDGYNGGGAGS